MAERGLDMLQQTVERLLRRGATQNLRKILDKTHPADSAYLVKHLSNRHANTLFELLADPETAGLVIAELEPAFRSEFLGRMEAERVVAVLTALPDDDAADILADLPEELREQILHLLEDEETEEVEELLSYPEDSAGRIMTTEFVALAETMTAREAVQEVRKAAEAEMVFYVYAKNEEGKLSGVVSLRQLVTASGDTPLVKFMVTDPDRVNVNTDQEEAARMVSRYNLLAVPVVDHEDMQVGIITVDDVIDVLREEATEDILKMAGTSDEEITSFSVLRSARVRLPWLFASWVGGLVAMQIIGHYESGFKEHLFYFTALAAFIPVIIGMGGNIGTQSLSITVRGLATGRLDPTLLWRVVGKEVGVGLLLGLAYGLLLGLVGWWLNQDFSLGLVVAIAMCANMTMAAVVGTFLPLIFSKLHIDPAVASGPFVTTSIDILGVAMYFLTASLILF